MDARSANLRLPAADYPADTRVDLRRQISLFRRRAGLFFTVLCAGCALSGAAILALPARYVASAEVVVDPHRQPTDLRTPAAELPLDSALIDTEVEILRSRALAETVQNAFGLDRDPEFNPRFGFSLWAKPEGTAAQVHERVLNRLERRLKVTRLGFSYVIDVSVRSASPAMAASLANAFTALYLQQQLEAKSTASRRAADLLKGRLGGLREEVDAAEHAVERYKAAHGLMTLAGPQGSTTTEQEISSLDAQLVAAQGYEAEANARLTAANTQTAAGRSGDDLAEVLNSPVVQDLRKQRDDAAKQIAELEVRYGPRHPEFIKAERRRVELDAQLGQEIARVVSNLKVQADVAHGHAAAIAAAVAASKAQWTRNNSASVELQQLEQNLDAVRTLYQAFLDRAKQTAAQDGLAQADARLVQPAKPPISPAFPNRLLLAAIGLTASIVAGLLALLIAEAREDGLYAPEDVEARLGVACLGLVPAAAGAKGQDAAAPLAGLIIEQPLSGFAEAFRTIRSGLLLSRSADPVRIVAVTSALAEEGKTTTAMCLGRIMARSGSTTVVVDCDLRRRTTSRLLAESPRVGLLDVLSGRGDLDAALAPDEASGLQVLPLGEEEATTDGILESPEMERILEVLRRRFRTVLLDTAPVLMVAETTALAAKADAVLFLTRWGRTSARDAADAVRRLENAGAYVAGAVLTQADLRHVSSGAYPYGADYYPFYRPEPARPAPFLRHVRRTRGRSK